MNERSTRRSGKASLFAAAAFLPVLLANPGWAKEETAGRASDNECVFSRSVHDWRALDSRNLVIWAPNRKEAYLVKLGFPVHDLRTGESLAFIDHNGDGRLCGYGMDAIATTNGPFSERATIIGMERLDEAGLAALGDQYNVKLVRPSADKETVVPLTDRPVK